MNIMYREIFKGLKLSNKEVKTKQRNQFENLKMLNNILNGADMSNLVNNVSKAKKALENFCKALKSRDQELMRDEYQKKQSESFIKAETKQPDDVSFVEVFEEKEKQTDEKTVPASVLSHENSNTTNKAEPAARATTLVSTNAEPTPKAKPYQNTRSDARPNYRNDSNRPDNSRAQNQDNRVNNFKRNNQSGANYQNNYQRNNPSNTTNYQNNYQRNNTGYQRQGSDASGRPNQFNPQNRSSNPAFNNRPFGNRAPAGTTGAPQFGGQRPFNPNYSRATDGQKPPLRSTGLLPKADRSETLIVKPERSVGNKNKARQNVSDKKELSIKSKMKMGYIEVDDYEVEGRIGRVRTKSKKSKSNNVVPEKIVIEKAEITTENLTVKMLAEKIGKPSAEIIKKFMMLGAMPSINSVIDFQTAELVANEFGVELELKIAQNFEEKLEERFLNQSNATNQRPPIVTVMGHVDHGKTSLLDAIKKTDIVSGEAGGITQHIGAYTVKVNNNKITFIDTPGHEAFTSMRARGAKITDVAILVVAADDGIMPQTIEAINHIKAAKVPMLVAINKMDKPEANPERIKQQLTEHGVLPEEWGGDTICVPISAKQSMGIEKLLEMVLLVSEVADLRADKDVEASGFVLESKIDKGRGILASIIVKNGTLKLGDFIISGVASGRIKAMMDHKGISVEIAEPSEAVSVLGFNKVPDAGDLVYVVDEKLAKNLIQERENKIKIERNNMNCGISLDDFLKQSKDTEMRNLNIIIKADVKGTSEALKDSLEKIENEEVKVNCVSTSVGGINESDVLLAQASNAIIIGFNVKAESKAKLLADKNCVEIRMYKIIYEAVDELTSAINGMKTPKFEEVKTGYVEVRQIFKVSSLGTIAGCYVKDGFVSNKSKAKVMRANELIAETDVETLKVQKDDAKTVKYGHECGIKLKNFNDIKVDDIIEFYEMRQI